MEATIRTSPEAALADFFAKGVRPDGSLLSLVPTVRLEEGDRLVLCRGGKEKEIAFKEHRESFALPLDANLDEFRAQMAAAAERMGQALTSTALEDIDEAVTEIGNTLSVDGDLRPEHLLEMLRKMEWAFDPKGNPAQPVLVVHPSMAARANEQMTRLFEEPEYRRQLEVLIQEKREAWRVREAGRILAG